MKYVKNTDILLFLLLFTTSQREKKYIKKTFCWVQVLKNGEKRRILRVLYRNIYRILKVNCQ